MGYCRSCSHKCCTLRPIYWCSSDIQWRWNLIWCQILLHPALNRRCNFPGGHDSYPPDHVTQTIHQKEAHTTNCKGSLEICKLVCCCILFCHSSVFPGRDGEHQAWIQPYFVELLAVRSLHNQLHCVRSSSNWNAGTDSSEIIQELLFSTAWCDEKLLLAWESLFGWCRSRLDQCGGNGAGYQQLWQV